MTRREFGLAAAAPAILRGAAKPVLLLRSGWQTENIGDIAHTPGLLALLEKHFKEARVILWSNALDRGVEAMLRRRFPALEIVSGDPESDPLKRAFDEAHFLLHGSGPSLVARNHVEAWRKQTGKPWGAFGITVTTQIEAASAKLDDGLRDVLSTAKFIYTRESQSLRNLKSSGISGPVLDFVPDATFSLDLRDDQRAKQLLGMRKLEPGRYLCVVPRLRYTPYHRMRKTNWSEETIRQREQVNQQHAEKDHAKLREAIATWVRSTELRVLLCPEMTYQVDLLKPLLYDSLPDDVRPQVVSRAGYWITDEAASIYSLAAAVLSFECHSPIIASAAGTPGLYVHQPEDGIKGQMWNDVGLGMNYFEVDDVTGEQLGERLKFLALNNKKERKQVRDAVDKIREIQARRIADLKRIVTASVL